MWPFQFYSQELKEFGYHCECVWIKEDRTEIIESGYSFDDISYFIYAKGPDVNYLGRAANVPVDMHFDIWRISLDSPEYIGDIPYPLTKEEKELINNVLVTPDEGGYMPTIYSKLIDNINSWHKSLSLGNEQETEELMKNMGWKDWYIMRDIHMPIPDYTLLP